MEKVLAMLKGGHNKFWGSFYVVARRFSHIVGGGGGGREKFPLFKRGVGAQKVLPCLGGGGAQKVSDPRFSHFVVPPPLPRN